MRVILLSVIIILGLSAACGGNADEAEITVDSTATAQPDTAQIEEMQHTSPQDAITGAYGLIDDARSAVDQENERTRELEQMMGDN